ncbi:MAG: DUF1292 domain-containing protein [Mogibacterium sp.]|nr:DUF1292 domain-containing protein [Mogibacterium sp.]
MSDEMNTFVEDEELDYITLEFDDNTAVDCVILGVFEADGKEYIALDPEDGTDDVYIYGYRDLDDDNFELFEVEDDAEFSRAAEVFDELMSEE